MQIVALELFTPELDSTKAFYSEILGLPIKESGDDFVTFIAASSQLTFVEKKSISPQYHFTFNIPQNQLQESLEWLSARTTILGETAEEQVHHFENWNAHSVYFYDNHNNILEFIARHDLNNETDRSFNNQSILNISEIGLVDEYPMQLAESLVSEFGLDYFSKGPKRNDFVVLGDDNGLIVISNPMRNWYPTNDKAQVCPTRVQLQTHPGKEIVELIFKRV